jgi:hypothetical protein
MGAGIQPGGLAGMANAPAVVRNQIISMKCLTGVVGILLPDNGGYWHFSCLITMAVSILLLDNVNV